MTEATGLREIERLDEAKIERVVAAVRPLLQLGDDAKWSIGDALLAEMPMVSLSEAGRRGRLRDPQTTRYLQAVGRALDRPATTLEGYRVTAAMWPTNERHPGVAWSKHLLVQSRPDRHDLISLPYDEIRRQIGRVPQAHTQRHRRQEHSFANISKAAEAAIEVLADEALPADKRVQIALSILVKFFEEAAA